MQEASIWSKCKRGEEDHDSHPGLRPGRLNGVGIYRREVHNKEEHDATTLAAERAACCISRRVGVGWTLGFTKGAFERVDLVTRMIPTGEPSGYSISSVLDCFVEVEPKRK
jgi:hypothetical protein